MAFAAVAVSGALYQDASAADFTSAEQAWIDSNTGIAVGSSDWPPYEYVDDNGDLAGVTADVVRQFESITGLTFTVSDAAGSWSDTLQGLRNGSVDVTFMIENTGPGDNARAGIAYTEAWRSVPTHIIVSDGNPSAVTVDNLGTKKIVTVRDYAVNQWLDANNVGPTVVGTTAEALRGVADGTYDAHIENWKVVQRISTGEGITGLASVGPSGFSYELSIGYAASNAIFGGILQKVLDSVDINAEVIRESFTVVENGWLDSNPTIDVGSADWPPYEYVDDNGDLAGVTAAIAERFSDITGSTFTASDAAGSWDDTLQGLKDGSVDVEFMIANTGPGDGARAGIAYTEPWLHVPAHIIVSDGNPSAVTVDNLGTRDIVTVRNYAVNQWLTENSIRFDLVGTTAEALRGVADGTYDAHIENWDVAQRISPESTSQLESVGLSGYTYDLSIGYTASNTVLGDILQKVLDGTQGEQQRLIDDALAKEGSPQRICR